MARDIKNILVILSQLGSYEASDMHQKSPEKRRRRKSHRVNSNEILTESNFESSQLPALVECDFGSGNEEGNKNDSEHLDPVMPFKRLSSKGIHSRKPSKVNEDPKDVESLLKR